MKNVLLVEDNTDDVMLMKIACQRTGIPHTLKIVTDGHEAVQYLSGEGDQSARAGDRTVDLIFLDMKLPGRDGHNVLEWIRTRPELKNVPVVMLTSLGERKDVDRAYSLGVTSFLDKNAALAEFGQGVRVILKYWLELNIPGTHQLGLEDHHGRRPTPSRY